MSNRDRRAKLARLAKRKQAAEQELNARMSKVATAFISVGFRPDKAHLSLVSDRSTAVELTRAMEELVRLRTRQVGGRGSPRFVGALGRKELDLGFTCEIDRMPRERGWKAFRRNVEALATSTADHIGHREEVWLSFGGFLFRADLKNADEPRGLTNEGPVQTAVLTIGLRVGKRRGRGSLPRSGEVIDVAVATRDVLQLRTQQVGAVAAAATISRCEGRWMDQSEPTLVCEIEFFPSAKEKHVVAFERNMGKLAEQVAERLGQREVLLKMGGNMYRANAPRERGPSPSRTGGRRVR